MALSDFLTLIASKIQDTADKLEPAKRLEALKAAVDEYSTVAPRRKVATVTGNGVLVTFALPADFEEGLSSIDAIEYPVDKQEPEYLDTDDYLTYRDPTTGALKLRIRTFVLANAAKMYVTYGAGHFVQSTPPAGETVADTVPRSDRDAVACLASSHCCMMLAAYYAQTSDPTMGADAVDYQSRTDLYLQLAMELRKTYGVKMGVTDGTTAASAIGDLDVDLQVGWDRFFHSRKGR